MESLTSFGPFATPYVTGLLLGAAAMLVLINLGQAWVRKEGLNLGLALYMVSLSAGALGWWSALILALLAQCWLSWRFAPLPLRFKRWGRVFIGGCGVLLLTALTWVLLSTWLPTSPAWLQLTFLASSALCLLHLLYLTRGGVPNAQLMLMAKVFSLAALSSIWWLRLGGSNGQLSYWLAQATLIVEGMLITYALVMTSVEHWQQRIRNHYERSQRLKLKQQYNTTLKLVDHELRTPLSGIVGIAELLQDTPLNKNQRDQVSTMRRASEALLKWLNRLNDWRALQIGRLHFDALPFDFSQLLQTLYEDVRVKAEDRKIRLSYTPHPNTPTLIKGDPARVKQIIAGALEMALFYSEQGDITLELSPTAQRNHWQLVIRDSQSGLHPQDIELSLADEREPDTGQHDSGHYSEPSSGSYSGNYSGNYTEHYTEHYTSVQRNWLIAKALAGHIGGQLTAELDGEHARFTCELVLTRYSLLQHHENEVDELLRRKRLLVVADSSSGRKVVAKRAESWGMVTTCVPNGKDALTMISTMHQVGACFDAIILDDDLPDMTGLQLAEHITRHGLNTVPVMIMLSGNHSLPQEGAARDVLIRRVLTKPISAQSLKITLAEELTLQQARHPPAAEIVQDAAS